MAEPPGEGGCSLFPVGRQQERSDAVGKCRARASSAYGDGYPCGERGNFVLDRLQRPRHGGCEDHDNRVRCPRRRARSSTSVYPPRARRSANRPPAGRFRTARAGGRAILPRGTRVARSARSPGPSLGPCRAGGPVGGCSRSAHGRSSARRPPSGHRALRRAGVTISVRTVSVVKVESVRSRMAFAACSS